MIRIEQRLHSAHTHDATLSLPIDQRVKSRLKVTLDDGREAGLFLPRGEILRGGDLLQSTEGLVIQVQAAAETVSTVHSENTLALSRVCYHLGNRHVPLQIAATWVRYQHDHVLDDMVRGLGLYVTVEQAPFEPEAGAYKSASHGHSHGPGRGHSHGPDHGHSHEPAAGDSYHHGEHHHDRHPTLHHEQDNHLHHEH